MTHTSFPKMCSIYTPIHNKQINTPIHTGAISFWLRWFSTLRVNLFYIVCAILDSKKTSVNELHNSPADFDDSRTEKHEGIVSFDKTHSGRNTHICVLDWVNLCLHNRYAAQSHYPNQCWLFVSWTRGNKFQCNLSHNMKIYVIQKMHLKMSAKWQRFVPFPMGHGDR